MKKLSSQKMHVRAERQVELVKKLGKAFLDIYKDMVVRWHIKRNADRTKWGSTELENWILYDRKKVDHEQ